MSKSAKTVLIWVLLVLVFFALYQIMKAPEEGSGGGGSNLGVLIIALGAIVGAVVFLVRRAASGQQGILTMRKNPARLVAEAPKVSFADVGGASEARERLGDIVDFLRDPERWKATGARLPRGVLLEGPPGTGKTLLARALAGEAKAAFFEVAATEFVELLVGVGPARVRDLFESAAAKAPAIIFIDELDAIGRRRGNSTAAALYVEHEQTLNQLLVAMDGFKPMDRVVIVAATNRADVLDEALLRPGRFDVRLTIPALDRAAREEVLRIHTRTKALSPTVDLGAVADATEHFTGAELEQVANEAALAMTRRGRADAAADLRVGTDDLLAAVARVQKRGTDGDLLTAVLHDSTVRVARPRGRLLVRVTLDEGAPVEGSLEQASPQFLQLTRADGSAVTVARAGVRRVEQLAALG